MPELPEVETIRRDLEAALLGQSINGILVYDRCLISEQEESRWKENVIGQLWISVGRRGKYLWMELSNRWRIIFHLRMTGQLIVRAHSGAPLHLRLSLQFVKGPVLELYDQRRFAEAWLLEPGQPWPSKQPMGPDALTGINRERFVEIVKSRTTRVQPLLMDQRLLAGVGNIYAQEALFRAAIRPSRSGCALSKIEAARLYDALQETLQTAIDHRGSTSRNYRDAFGRQGEAQTLHAVYRKGGKPCPRCGASLRASRVGGRGTVYCSQCQR